MKTRFMLPARTIALFALLAAFFLVPAFGHAQSVSCNGCDHFIFEVGHLACSVQVCYQTAPGTVVVCNTVGPGGSLRIPCPVSQAWVNTCSGPYYLVPSASASRCSRILKLAAGCCGQICNVPSPDNCTVLQLETAPCESDSCP